MRIEWYYIDLFCCEIRNLIRWEYNWVSEKTEMPGISTKSNVLERTANGHKKICDGERTTNKSN